MTRSNLTWIIWLVRFFANAPLFWMFYFLHFQEEGLGGTFGPAFNALLLCGWCSLHSLLARDVAKQTIAKVVGSHCVRAFYVVVSGTTFSLVLYFWQPIPGILWKAEGTLYWLLTLLYIGCIIGMLYTTRFFDMGEFLGIRAYFRALNDRPPKPPAFSVQGPYAYCRHPMYLFFLGILWIGPTMTYGRLEFAVLGTAYFLVGTFLEERNLRRELGEVYDVYRENVPMWIPRLTPWKYESVASEDTSVLF